MLIYDCPEVYDLYFSDNFHEETAKFFKTVFKEKRIATILDCSVGTGQFLIPLQDLGHIVTGTDVNLNMIRRARKNFASKNLIADLKVLDPTKLTSEIGKRFDCCMMTGNRLGNLTNEKIPDALNEMYHIIKPGGYLFLDSRNWDLILKRRQRFYLYNPIIRDKGRVNLLEVWDYQKNDKKMLFNYLVSEEIDNNIVSKRQFFSIFYPFSLTFLRNALKEIGFIDIEIFKLGDINQKDISKINWYSILAKKPAKPVAKTKKKSFFNSIFK